MFFEVEYIRSVTIKANNLNDMDEKYYFYYDESNNFRKFRLKENEKKFNAPINSNFVLGGVVHEKNAIDYDYYKLIENLNLQKTVKEIKLKNIAKGDFVQCLKSNRLNIFLNWLLKSDLYIHYFVLNLFYFSIVDIVDLAISNSKNHMNLPKEFVNIMKSNLYTIAKREEDSFISLMLNYNYPNLDKNKISDFLCEIINFIRIYEDETELHIGLVSLKKILNVLISENKLLFLEDNESKDLIEDFVPFYIQPIYMFLNSIHDFDEESFIFDSLKNYEITYQGKLINNYKQSNSKNSKLIQISDIVVGLIAKYCDYVIGTSIDKIKTTIKEFNFLQSCNLYFLRELIDKTNEYNKAFLHYSISEEDKIKFSLFGT